MCCNIRSMEEKDRAAVLSMMKEFYTSPAVLSNGSDEIFRSDFDHCVGACPNLDGYILEDGGAVQGYAMVAKSFSTEFGKPCMWLEDLYIRPAYRGLGLGSRFLRFMQEQYPDAVFRLDIEEENERAVAMYRKHGFDVFPYMQMKK